MNDNLAPVREGDELPPLTILPTLHQVVRYAALTWSFTPLFWDAAESERGYGVSHPIVPANLKLGYLDRAVKAWLGNRGFVREVRAAHRLPDRQNAALIVQGRVARVYTEEGASRADIELVVLREATGEPSVRGFATVEFR